MRDYFKNSFFGILPSKLRKKVKLILGLLSVSGFLESLSIGLFIPLITIISEGRMNFPILNNFYDFKKFEINEILPLIVF